MIQQFYFYSNCFFYALSQYKEHGGYVAFRKSRMGSWFPHVIWIGNLNDAEIKHFVPVNTKPLKIPPPVFEGYVKTNDRL